MIRIHFKKGLTKIQKSVDKISFFAYNFTSREKRKEIYIHLIATSDGFKA